MPSLEFEHGFHHKEPKLQMFNISACAFIMQVMIKLEAYLRK
jgi:hypothetical protein